MTTLGRMFSASRRVSGRGADGARMSYPVPLGLFARREEARAACWRDAAAQVLLDMDVRCKV